MTTSESLFSPACAGGHVTRRDDVTKRVTSTRKNNKELRVTFKEKPWPNSHLGHARDISDTKAYDNDEKQWDLMGLNEKIIMDFKEPWWPMEHSQWQQMDTQRNY